MTGWAARTHQVPKEAHYPLTGEAEFGDSHPVVIRALPCLPLLRTPDVDPVPSLSGLQAA